ncbi:hypothetical protein [Streptomyces palmae]|uniref:Uncharacterized protein n=1 Tax=Streptomyces palmae TaxID=1701085 RepID=A0A4Z0HB42_9ACTN|nr:hypothetical protein [Streptomyces palmae]TGB07575.1 hypothetical protein E4099_16875 [Streptomyces palmae]
MARWGLIAETSERWGEGRSWTATVLGYAEGTRESALRELERHARERIPAPGRRTPRVRFFRQEDGFLMIVREGIQTRYTVAELLYDSEAPPPEPEVPLDADGVPVTPSWLRRGDLP